VALYSLSHVIDEEWMREAYRLTRKSGAPGIDGVVAAEYESNLEVNLQSLLGRIRSGSYTAPPVRRAYIPKADGTQRPLGIPTFEDKVAQRAISMVLEAIYEQDFYPCSYGFRPGRSAHQALQALRTGFMTQGLRWVLDVDIRKYFDSIPHKQLREFLDRRVTDGVIRRMIDKWLKAGVMEEGQIRQSTEGSPQGGVITPLTQKVISSSNGQLRDGEQGTLYLIYVLRSNTFMAYGAVDQSGEGSAAERRSWPTPASCCTSRSSAAIVTRVRFVRASSIPLLRGGLPARATGRSYRGHGADHVEASAAHGGTAAKVREKQWPDYWSDRDRRVERVSRRSEETWLSRAPRAAHFKSVLTMPLIDCTIQSSLRPTVFWCRFGSVPSAVV
jgi:hypothetical protein